MLIVKLRWAVAGVPRREREREKTKSIVAVCVCVCDVLEQFASVYINVT